MTVQRKLLIEQIRTMKTHPTADELYRAMREKLPSISLGTIYRNLELLSKEGIIRKIEVAGNKRRYDGTLSSHAHIRCAICGRIEDIEEDGNLLRLAEEVITKKGFEIYFDRTEFVGICPRCRIEMATRKKAGGGLKND